MALTRYEPWNLLSDLQRDLSRVFDQNPAEEPSGTPLPRDWAPAVDIKEEKDRFVILADLPGIDARDIEITMDKGVLTLRGQRVFEDEKESENYRRVERMRGTFVRRFSLPDAVQADKISARSRHGVLELVVPKAEQAKPRRITVES